MPNQRLELKTRRVGRSLELHFLGEDSVISLGRNVVRWSLLDGKRVCSAHPFSHPSHLDVSPSGHDVVVKNTSGRLVVLRSQTLETIVSFPPDDAAEGCQALYSPCGTRIVDGTWRGILRSLNASTGEVAWQQVFEGAMIRSLSRSLDRVTFAYVIQPKTTGSGSLAFSRIAVRNWPLDSHAAIEVDAGEAYVDAIALSPDGTRLAVLQMGTLTQSSVIIVDIATGERRSSRPIHRPATNYSLAWSPDSSKLACIENGCISVFDTLTLKVLAKRDTACACHAAFSADGSLVGIGSWEDGVVLPVSLLDSGAPPSNSIPACP